MPLNLTFNIIFTPGSVKYMRLGILSLLEFLPYKFRLISNGLDLSERLLLKHFCDTDARLEFYPFPTGPVLPHGILLRLLEQRNADEGYFCFMDYDIFVTGQFHGELEERLKKCDVFSSCRNFSNDLILKDNNDVDDILQCKRIRGRRVKFSNGITLASTHFAIYRTEPLKRVIRETGISFEKYQSPDLIPCSTLNEIRDRGFIAEVFDTGKLMNIISLRFGLKYDYYAFDNLLHIGGITRSIERRSVSLRSSGFELLKKLVRLGLNASKKDEKDKMPDLRMEIADYFLSYIKWLFGEDKKPVWKTKNHAEVDDEVKKVSVALYDLYEKHQDKLVTKINS